MLLGELIETVTRIRSTASATSALPALGPLTHRRPRHTRAFAP
jgi:hypothetical protein